MINKRSPKICILHYAINTTAPVSNVAGSVYAGLLPTEGNPIWKRLVEQYLRSIGQIFASVGAKHPSHNSMGKLEFFLGRQISSYKKVEPPHTRVLPLSIHIVHALDTTLRPGTTSQI